MLSARKSPSCCVPTAIHPLRLILGSGPNKPLTYESVADAFSAVYMMRRIVESNSAFQSVLG
jgi:hypothetical protein